MFSEIIQTADGKLRIKKLTGQRLTAADLNKGAVESNSEMVLLLLDCPLACTMHESSNLSFKMPSLLLE